MALADVKALELYDIRKGVARKKQYLWAFSLLWIACFFLAHTAMKYAGSNNPADALSATMVLNFVFLYITVYPFVFFILLFLYFRNKRKARYLTAELS
jgi:Mn2+/Fe2+ NRAMP family transporter